MSHVIRRRVACLASALIGALPGVAWAQVEEPVEPIPSTRDVEREVAELRTILEQDVQELGRRLSVQGRLFQAHQEQMNLAAMSEEEIVAHLELLTYRLAEMSEQLLRADELREQIEDRSRRVVRMLETVQDGGEQDRARIEARRQESITNMRRIEDEMSTSEYIEALRELRAARASGTPPSPEMRRVQHLFNRALVQWAGHRRSADRLGRLVDVRDEQRSAYPELQRRVLTISEEGIRILELLEARKIEVQTSAFILRANVEQAQQGLSIRQLVQEIGAMRVEAREIDEEVANILQSVDGFTEAMGRLEDLTGIAQAENDAAAVPAATQADAATEEAFLEAILGRGNQSPAARREGGQ